MKTMRYWKATSLLPILALVFPCIPMVITIVQAINMLSAGLDGYVARVYLLGAALFFILMTALPVCGGAGMLCSILALRKLGRKKRIIAAIVWNGLTLLLGIALLYIYYS